MAGVDVGSVTFGAVSPTLTAKAVLTHAVLNNNTSAINGYFKLFIALSYGIGAVVPDLNRNNSMGAMLGAMGCVVRRLPRTFLRYKSIQLYQ